MSLSSFTFLRVPSSRSDSSLCLRSRFIKEILVSKINFTLISNASRLLICTMQYIPNLSEYIETLAYSSVYETNRNAQVNAQQVLTNFIFQMGPDDCVYILQTFSETVVLAFAAVVLKNNAAVLEHLPALLPKVNQVLAGWYQPNGVFKRSQGDELKNYVENTLGTFLGNSLKLLFRRAETKAQVGPFLDSMQEKPHYRLYVYYRFIEHISFFDIDMNYVDYRTMLRSFQSAFISRIFDVLYPYFINISDSMDVHELSRLHNSLSFNDSPQRSLALEFSGKNRFTEIVFLLLAQVVSFRYDIKEQDFEFQMEEIQNVQVNFPSHVFEKILKQGFLDALYNILQTLVRTNELKYQQASLNCLSKILLTKLLNLKQQDEKKYFVFTNMEGVLKLLTLILEGKVAHRLSAIQILKCTTNFAKTFGLNDIEKRMDNEQRYIRLLQSWLETARQIPIFILKYYGDPLIPLDSENELFLATMQMTTELANELKVNNVHYNKEDYANSYRELTSFFLQNFLRQEKSVLGSKLFSFEELTISTSQFLGSIKIVSTFDYAETFRLLTQYCDFLYQTDKEINIGNLILFIHELISDYRVFEQSIFGRSLFGDRYGQMQEASGEVDLFAIILGKTLSFILKYQSQTTLPCFYLNNAIVVFLCSLITKWSKKISIGTQQREVPPFINDEIYSRVKAYMNGNSDEEFLLNSLLILTNFISCPIMRNLDFIFQQFFDIINFIKTGMKREYFIKTRIYQAMIKLFTSLSLEKMPIEFMKWRKLLFRIITTLSFDDTIDEYRENIRKTIEIIKMSAMQGEWAKILYDLIGIFETIDKRLVFRYFLRKLLKQINFEVLLRGLFVNLGFANPKTYLKAVMYLSWTIVQNRNNRIGSEDCSKNIYQMIVCIIPFWNQYLKSEAVSETEDSLLEVYNSFSGLIDGKHINICLLDQIAPVNFRTFFQLIMRSLCKSLDSIQSQSQLSQAMFALTLQLTNKPLKALFDMEDPEIGRCIHYFINCLMRKLKSSFDKLASGQFKQKWVEPILKTLDQYYSFVRFNCKMIHLPNLNSKIRQVIADSAEKQSFLETMIKVAMEFRQQFSGPLHLIANISVNLIDFYNLDANLLVEGLGLKDESDIREVKRIFVHIRQATEDYDWLALQMKDWLKMRNRFTQFSPDDY